MFSAAGGLGLQRQRRAAGACDFQVENDIDVVRDLTNGMPPFMPFFAGRADRPLDPRARLGAVRRGEQQRLRFGDAAQGEHARNCQARGPVCVIFVERKVMTGLFFTSKNLSPLRTPFFIPSPVSTELASTVSLRTPVEV